MAHTDGSGVTVNLVQDPNGTIIPVLLDTDHTVGHIYASDTDPNTAGAWAIADSNVDPNDPNAATIARTITLADPSVDADDHRRSVYYRHRYRVW